MLQKNKVVKISINLSNLLIPRESLKRMIKIFIIHSKQINMIDEKVMIKIYLEGLVIWVVLEHQLFKMMYKEMLKK